MGCPQHSRLRHPRVGVRYFHQSKALGCAANVVKPHCVVWFRAGESRVEWEILLTAEVEAFLDELYESDPTSHQLANQAILVLERSGPA